MNPGDLANIGTDANRIRASSLPELLRCPWTWLMKQLKIETDESGEAADTGSAVHAACAAFHGEAKQDVADSVRRMKARGNEFPAADIPAAVETFYHYAKDTRNTSAVIVYSESGTDRGEVTLTLPPHETDKTGQDIIIPGHLDQCRRINGRLAVVDIKTGKGSGPELLNHNAYQLAAYQLAAAIKLGELVHNAFVLRTRDYLARVPGPVLWQAPWSYKDLGRMMLTVRRAIARIRNGEIDPIPGPHCNWCSLANVGNCIPRLVQLGGIR